MSFIRSAWPLRYFKDTSHEYVFISACPIEFIGKDSKKKEFVEDYGSKYGHKPSLIELLGNFILRCTDDEEYTWKMVQILAKDLKVDHLLRKKPATFEQIFKEMQKICEKNKHLWVRGRLTKGRKE